MRGLAFPQSRFLNGRPEAGRSGRLFNERQPHHHGISTRDQWRLVKSLGLFDPIALTEAIPWTTTVRVDEFDAGQLRHQSAGPVASKVEGQ